MSWLRIDDNMISHPKIRALTDTQYRVWMRTLSHCSRMDDPTVDEGVINELKGLNASTVKRFSDLGLLDETPHGHKVHGWEKYRRRDVTSQERTRRHRDKKRDEQRDNHRDETVTRATRVPDPLKPSSPSSSPNYVSPLDFNGLLEDRQGRRLR
jgi:hypothetical protein